ncbi:MAG: c-type cytochrome [Deltaproteobacteria bacterium]|nr:c-type cytochrome [Deltaproteobacteria bacterium]
MVNRNLIILPLLAALFLFAGKVFAGDAPPMSEEEFSKAKQIYFDRCAGCHGTLRKGATGPSLTTDKTQAIPVQALETLLSEGTPGGMPPWKNILSKQDITLVAKYLQNEPPQPPQWGLEDMRKSWKVYVPVEKRPVNPPNGGTNWQNFFGVILRNAGKVAIIDGDTKKIVTTLDTGYAVHILRTSATGRYMYSIGRDGKATLIDLWASPPNIVAEIKTGFDARSIDTSKFAGSDHMDKHDGDSFNYLDRYAIVGDYWPSHYVIMKGDTLEPLKVVSTLGYTYDTNEYLPEARVAAIVASHSKPEWVVNIKEAGVVLLVDYSKLENGTITETRIDAERFLHDGGWDSTKRYFMVAANMRNKVAVIDTVERKLVALVDTGNKPHPGRGANWDDPKYGPVWATTHLGEGKISVIGTDPIRHSRYSWRVVRELQTAGNGLFVKTHPKSNNIWADNTLSKDLKDAQTITVFDKNNIDAGPTNIKLTDKGKIVHLEYNKAGDEVWISVWDNDGEIIVIDDKTRQIKNRIKGLVTPTGKFNVYNTMLDIY